ncbi:MAG: hypothetical protein ACOYKE_01375 [Ferruginibacter sp.]
MLHSSKRMLLFSLIALCIGLMFFVVVEANRAPVKGTSCDAVKCQKEAPKEMPQHPTFLLFHQFFPAEG